MLRAYCLSLNSIVLLSVHKMKLNLLFTISKTLISPARINGEYFDFFRIFDDMEMYEQQDPFKLTDFVTMSYFLNQFLYKAVLNNLFGNYHVIKQKKKKTSTTKSGGIFLAAH